ncbi:MAG: haloacid dehalogenase-like hydrolase [Lentisphaeria bacterium]|nr:haloacid dehalogenase-like hydrolase [Lentisphaeria bacterium]
MKIGKWKIVIFTWGLLVALVLTGCAGAPLALWNDGAPAKSTLIEYVTAVTSEGSADYIPVERRIAVFDLDGTLLLETDPTYFDWVMFERRVLDDPTCRASAEQTAAARAAQKGVLPPLNKNRERMVSQAYKGMTLDEFEAFVRKFMAEDQPGFTGLKRGDALYRPMIEVVNYLRDNGFTVYVVSGTDRLTVRPLLAALRLPPHQIIGSDSTIVSSRQGDRDALDYTFARGDTLMLGGENLVKCLQMNKVSAIVREIGVQPVLAFGNTRSDASMLNYTICGNRYRALGFMLLCDDLEREYGNMKKADQMRRDCRENGWIPVSMRDDWKTIYGDGVTKRKGSGSKK